MIGAVSVFKDNTQKLISSEQQLKIAMNEANSANKAKSIFLARMSHELRTPLNAILGFSKILKKSKNITIDEKNNLGIIRRSGEHLLHIINEILELSKIEAGKLEITPKVFNFKDLINDIDSIFAFRCKEKRLEFNIKLESNIPNFVKVDELRLKQILINLLSNSLKFTKEGEISIYVYENSNKLFFEISDTGIGISKENIKKIFKPFEQVSSDDSTNGTGLGLSITKELITLMNGSIYVKSVINSGSTFYFSISYEKVLDEKDIQIESHKDILEIKSFNKKVKVLVVDDIEINRELLSLFLLPYGIDVVKAQSGYEALEFFEKEKFNLIFMDIKMKGMDGIETIKNIRSKDLNIPIVVVSANVFQEDIEYAIKSGANSFLAKPIDEKDLLKVLEENLQLDILYKESNEEFEFEKELDKLDLEFFKKLNEYSLMMDKDSIEKLLLEYKVNEGISSEINKLINNFNYQELFSICEKKLKNSNF